MRLLGTGGGVKRALPMLHSDPILVMNTDAFWPSGSDTPIAPDGRALRGADEIVLLCVHPRDATGFPPQPRFLPVAAKARSPATLARR